MKNTFLFILILCWLFICSFTITNDTIIYYKDAESVVYDTIPYMVEDAYFIEAYNEITNMLEGKDSLSFKKAEFLVEWAYLKGNLDYTYCSDIDSVVSSLQTFIYINNLQNYKTGGNFALFEYFTKSSPLNGDKPFKYDFEDFAGEKDFSNMFVTKAMATHSGQCYSLPAYYKILSDELGSESFLALAPNHMYIKHLSEDGKWVNIELTNGHFSTDAWMISSMDISAEAIKNKVYLNALNEKESVALTLCQLALAYEKRYGLDYFPLQCADQTLTYFPHYMPALFIKFNTHRYLGLTYLEEFGQMPSNFVSRNYTNYIQTKNLIENLGYRELSQENYQEWLFSMDKEIEKQKLENSK